jgi:uncharacterized phage protein (TIGR02218 family)
LQQQPLLQFYLPSCRFRFGDSRCGIDTDALKVTGTVTAVSATFAHNNASRRTFGDSARTEADGYFQYGTLTWTSGANTGHSSEVKAYTQAGGVITLWTAMVHPIEVGDGYEMIPGCALTEAACIFWDNYENFGGYPDVPGQDAIIRAPDSKG